MRQTLLLCVCLTSFSTAFAQKDQIESKRAQQAFSVYDSEIREVNQLMLKEAAKRRSDLMATLAHSRKQALGRGDAAEAQAIAIAEATQDFAVPIMLPSRSYWEHPKGYFIQTGSKDWIEKTATGTAILYTEVDRTQEYIALAVAGEKGKTTLIRLYADRSAFQKPDQKAFTVGLKGRWTLPAHLH
jgi:hypothetical protein